MAYAYSENFILPISHDEVVHGKGSMFERAPQDEWRKFAHHARLLRLHVVAPGQEAAVHGHRVRPEARVLRGAQHRLVAERRAWGHHGVQRLVKDLNDVYRAHPALWKRDTDPSGFSWINADDAGGNVFSFLRYDGEGQMIACVTNFSAEPRHGLPDRAAGGGRVEGDPEHRRRASTTAPGSSATWARSSPPTSPRTATPPRPRSPSRRSVRCGCASSRSRPRSRPTRRAVEAGTRAAAKAASPEASDAAGKGGGALTDAEQARPLPSALERRRRPAAAKSTAPKSRRRAPAKKSARPRARGQELAQERGDDATRRLRASAKAPAGEIGAGRRPDALAQGRERRVGRHLGPHHVRHSRSRGSLTWRPAPPRAERVRPGRDLAGSVLRHRPARARTVRLSCAVVAAGQGDAGWRPARAPR